MKEVSYLLPCYLSVIAFVVFCISGCPQSEQRNHWNISLEQRFHQLEVQHSEASALLHLQGTLILELQVKIPLKLQYGALEKALGEKTLKDVHRFFLKFIPCLKTQHIK